MDRVLSEKDRKIERALFKERQRRVQNAYDFTQLGLETRRVMQKIVLYTHIDPTHLLHEGEALGITGDALKSLMRLTTVKISADVDTLTGEVSNIKIV